MTQFIVSLLVFLGLHSIPAIPAIRQRLVARLGRVPYLALYSLVSLAALAWVFHAALQLDYVELWPPSAWQAWFSLILSPVALFLLIAGLISANPVSISFRRADTGPGAVVSISRHPVLWGSLLWALGHVLSNGDLRSLLLFGAFALFSLFGMLMAERRHRRRQPERFAALARTTSVMPFVAIARGRAHLRIDLPMMIAALAAIVLTAWLLLGGHAALFGADPLAMAGT